MHQGLYNPKFWSLRTDRSCLEKGLTRRLRAQRCTSLVLAPLGCLRRWQWRAAPPLRWVSDRILRRVGPRTPRLAIRRDSYILLRCHLHDSRRGP